MTTPPHPLVAAAGRLAAEVLAPRAERVDQEGVPASSIEAVKRSGLLGVSAPVAYGGSAAPAAVVRETAEILAGACCSTWFVQTQHHTPVLTLAKGEPAARERLLGPLASGELLSGSRTHNCGPTRGSPFGSPGSVAAGASTGRSPGTRAGD